MKSKLRYLLPLLAAAAGPLASAEVKELRVLAQAGTATADKVERRVTVRQGAAPAEKEKVPFLGVSTGPVAPTLASQLGLTPGAGLVVNQVVPASPSAGVLQVHDVLVKLDDQLLIEAKQLAVLVRSRKEGDEVTVTYVRAGKQATAKVKLAVHEVPKWAAAGDAAWPANGTINIIGPESGPGSFGRQEVDRVLALIDSQRVTPPAGGAQVHVSKLSTENSTMVLSDDEGLIEITSKNGQKHVLAKDPKGATLFDGPITNEREQAAVPPAVRARLEKLEGMQDFQFKTGEDFKDGEAKVLTPPARKISQPRGPAPARRVETF